MAVFSVNQATHLYKLSDTAVKQSGDHIYFLAEGADGTLRTDLINKKNIMSVKDTDTDKMRVPYKTYTLTLKSNALDGGNVIPGEYVVRFIANNYYGPSMYDGLIKHAAVFVGSNTKEADFYTELTKSITKNLSREIEKPFTATADASGINVEPVATTWVKGTKAVTVPSIDIVGVYKDFGNGFEEEWLDVDKKNGTYPEGHALRTSGSQKLCDLEYFALGERGDQYRNVGWPNVVETKGVLDPETKYDVVTVHYAYVGSNESVQKSEKDMVLVVEAGQGKTLKTNIESAME